MHQPLGGIGGTASDIKIQAERMLKMKKRLVALIAQHSGQTVGADRGGRRPRPLVRRRGGGGLRPVDKVISSVGHVQPPAA